MTRPNHFLKAVALATMAFAGAAGAQISEEDRQLLIDFYHATEGDNWRHNDGWLGAAGSECEWYGVTCQFWMSLGRDVIRRLELPDNNLRGELPGPELFENVHWELDLSGNRIAGPLPAIPRSPGRVDLSNNRFSGTLPAQAAEPGSTGIWYLDLSGNDLEGEVPDSWPGLVWLNLSDNRLEGFPDAVFANYSSIGLPRYLNLAGNRFSGKLPSWIMDTPIARRDEPIRWGGGINLCWNDFEIDDPGLIEWLGERHVGGEEFESCLGRERVALGARLGGSWFDPERSGEGITVQRLDDDRALLFWFTYDEEGNQRWLFEVGFADGPGARWPELRQTRGVFDQGLLEADDAMEVRGAFRMDPVGIDSVKAERIYIIPLQLVCVAVYPPPLACFGDSIPDRGDYTRLTHLAGSTCDNEHSSMNFSGVWYSPERNGEGFVVEVLPDNQALVYWFTYTPDGSGQQAWMMGMGAIEPSYSLVLAPAPPPGGQPFTVHIDEVVQPLGGVFGPDFDPNAIEMRPWGSLTFEFLDDLNGHVLYDSVHEAYGAGDYPLQRLTRPMLADCGD